MHCITCGAEFLPTYTRLIHGSLKDGEDSPNFPPSPQLPFGVRQQTIQDVELSVGAEEGWESWVITMHAEI